MRRGDVVATATGGVATVKCVVATRCAGREKELVELPGSGGVLVTLWHPVCRPGTQEWALPIDLAPWSSVTCDEVVSFVLEPATAGPMLIGGYAAATLGHGARGPVIEHAFYGTTAVLQDLAGMHGWEEGLVRLQPEPAVRDPATGLVVGLRQEEAIPAAGRPATTVVHAAVAPPGTLAF